MRPLPIGMEPCLCEIEAWNRRVESGSMLEVFGRFRQSSGSPFELSAPQIQIRTWRFGSEACCERSNLLAQTIVRGGARRSQQDAGKSDRGSDVTHLRQETARILAPARRELSEVGVIAFVQWLSSSAVLRSVVNG
jgi:hypothetical protein